MHLVVQDTGDGVAVGSVSTADPAVVFLDVGAEHPVTADGSALAAHTNAAHTVLQVASGAVHNLQGKASYKN